MTSVDLDPSLDDLDPPLGYSDRTATFQRLFEEQVDASPGAVALAFDNESLSYSELNIAANKLAHHLRRLGLGPETIVGLCFERSLEMIVALLAVLKSGAAYVPLDPSYPSERLEYMLTDSGAGLVLSQEHLRAQFLNFEGQVVCLGEAAPRGGDAANPAPLATSDTLAYVIYTSGSTGTPKGVGIEHGSLANLAQAQRTIFGIGPGDRILQFASMSFDASVWEIVAGLLHGATLVIPSDRQRRWRLGRVLADSAITFATLPPTALEGLEAEDFPALRYLMLAGEQCPPRLARIWLRGRRFFNGYGPTENTVCATLFEVMSVSPDQTVIPIGRPLPNVHVYVLDQNLNRVPDGEPGELFIGGTGLARGYIHRPDLTAERFVPDIYGSEPGGRLYRSGDLVRYLPEGTLEFLGRVDHQIKIRGFRIEPSEIEMTLRAHPDVRETAVLPDVTHSILVAYITVRNRASLAALNEFMTARLPEFMLPTIFVQLEAMPLTANEKIDRNALLALGVPQESVLRDQ